MTPNLCEQLHNTTLSSLRFDCPPRYPSSRRPDNSKIHVREKDRDSSDRRRVQSHARKEKRVGSSKRPLNIHKPVSKTDIFVSEGDTRDRRNYVNSRLNHLTHGHRYRFRRPRISRFSIGLRVALSERKLLPAVSHSPAQLFTAARVKTPFVVDNVVI